MTATVTDPPSTPSCLVRHTVQTSVTIRDTFAETKAMAWRALIKMRRTPEQLVDVSFMPLMLTVLFGFMFGGAISGNTASYLPVLIPGIVAMSTISACVAAGTQLREDMNKGVFDRFRSLPIARISPLAGPMMADLVRYALAASVTITMGMIMGYRPGGGALGVAGGVLLAVITGWSLAWIFMWLGTFAKNAGSVQGMSMMIMFPLAFVSNAFVPVNTLPGWLRTLVRVSPVSHVVSALRDLMNKGAVTMQVGWALAGCAAVAAFFVPLAVRSYSRQA
jgi:ABC-2 type transport system permease protein